MKRVDTKTVLVAMIAGGLISNFGTSSPSNQSHAQSTPPAGQAGQAGQANLGALTCPKCQGSMEHGILVDYYQPGSPSQAVWAHEKMGKSIFSKLPKETKIIADRCTTCGYLELYAKNR